jgi:hypothetical protein
MSELQNKVKLSDEKINNILEILAQDQIINMFDEEAIGLLKFIDLKMLTHRQIVKKIFSYNPQLTDRDLNLMLWGQDLEKVLGKGNYIPYLSETEDLVNFNTEFTPMDIRGFIKEKTNDLITDVRKEIRTIESGILQLIDKLPKAVTEAITGVSAVVIPQGQMPPAPMIGTNPLAASQISLKLHNTSHVLNNVIKSILDATRVLTSVNKLTIGISGNAVAPVVFPKILQPSINGAPAINIPEFGVIPPMPKLHLLLSDDVLITLYDKLINPILDLTIILAEIVVGLDAAALALDAIALGPANAILLGLQNTLKSQLSVLASTALNATKAAVPAGGSFGSSINDANSSANAMKQAQEEYNKHLEEYKKQNTQDSEKQYVKDYLSKNGISINDAISAKNAWNSYISGLYEKVKKDIDNINNVSKNLPGGENSHMDYSLIPQPYLISL